MSKFEYKIWPVTKLGWPHFAMLVCLDGKTVYCQTHASAEGCASKVKELKIRYGVKC